MRLFACVFSCLFIASLPVKAQSASNAPIVKISQFSGKPVPRYESLKFPAVHGRVGPSLDHPIMWRYERQGLPVLILKESQDWRYIRDPDGDEVWVHARMLETTKTVIVRNESILMKAMDDAGKPVAVLEKGVIANLQDCSAAWCEISKDGHRGYVHRANIWGGLESEAEL